MCTVCMYVRACVRVLPCVCVLTCVLAPLCDLCMRAYTNNAEMDCTCTIVTAMKYPPIHTNYIISHCTTLQYIIIIYDTIL